MQYTISETGVYNLVSYARRESNYAFYRNGSYIFGSSGTSISHNVNSKFFMLNQENVISCSFSGTCNGLISKVKID